MIPQIFALTADAVTTTATRAFGTVEIVLGAALMVLAVLITIAVLMQTGKEKNLSGAISGSSDSFFAKSKTNTKDKIISRGTLILSIIFAILVVVMYIYVSP